MLTQTRLKELLHYDPDTGWFTWLITKGPRAKIGTRAGTLRTIGYRQILIDGVLNLEHRLAWLYMTGNWPSNEIDHINFIRDDNKFINLQDILHRHNLQRTIFLSAHNKLGVRGVSKRNSKYLAHIYVNNKYIRIGLFQTIKEASEAYQAAKVKHHPN